MSHNTYVAYVMLREVDFGGLWEKMLIFPEKERNKFISGFSQKHPRSTYVYLCYTYATYVAYVMLREVDFGGLWEKMLILAYVMLREVDFVGL